MADLDPGTIGSLSIDGVAAVIDLIPDGIVVLSPDGTIVLVNSVLSQALGYSPELLIGRSIASLVEPSERDRTTARLREYEVGVTLRANRHLVRCDGERRTIELIGTRLSDGHIAAVLRDVTEAEAERASLAQSRDKLRAAVEAGLDAWFVLDAVRDAAGHVIDFVYADLNGPAEVLLGRPIDTVVGRRVTELYPDAQGEVAALARVVEGGRPMSQSYRSSVGAFAHRYFQRHVVPIGDGVALVLRDETERTREAEALAESEQQFRGAWEHSALGIGIVGLDGTWLSVNTALCRMLGFEERELLQLTFRDVTHPEHLPTDLAQRDRMVRGETRSYEVEKRYLRKDGREIWALLMLSLVRSRNGDPRYFVAQILDMSERKAAREALRESEAAHRELLASLPAIVYVAAATPPYEPEYVSPGIEMLGYSLKEWLAQPDMWLRAVHPDDRDGVTTAAERAIATGEPFEHEYRVHTKAGAVRWIHDRGEFARDAEGRAIAWRGVMLDVTERRLLQMQLAALSEEDELTRLLNRRGFRRMAEQTLKVEQRSGRRVSLLYFDVDRFKAINDSFGHAEGDRALQLVADALRNGVREGDLVARFGGDEFVVLAVGVAGDGEGELMAKRLGQSVSDLSQHASIEAPEYTIGLSCGVVERDASQGLDAMLHLADMRLYAARAGR